MKLGQVLQKNYQKAVSFSDATVGNHPTVTIHGTPSSDSFSLASTETAVSWLPRGITGSFIRALGPHAVRIVEVHRIKKRLSSIGSQVGFRITCGSVESFSETETESYRTAYEHLLDLSRSVYKIAITSQAITLRLQILKALIISETSILDDIWYRHTARKLFEDLDDLSTNFVDTGVGDHIHCLRMLLIDKLALELVDRDRLTGTTSGSIMSGVRIVCLLCNDLAYGFGGYSVQYALLRISHQHWGHDELLRISQEGDVIVACVRRLLNEFNNPYSTAMAFRIFGSLPNIGVTSLLSGPDGIGRLVNLFGQGKAFWDDRSFRAVCVALDAACQCGHAEGIVSPEFLANLSGRLHLLNEHDIRTWRTLQEEEAECIDYQQVQVALCLLMANLTRSEKARIAIVQAGITPLFRKFCIHTNRLYSPWSMRHFMSQALERLETAGE